MRGHDDPDSPAARAKAYCLETIAGGVYPARAKLVAAFPGVTWNTLSAARVRALAEVPGPIPQPPAQSVTCGRTAAERDEVKGRIELVRAEKAARGERVAAGIVEVHTARDRSNDVHFMGRLP